ncbi:MAG: hypothetical protein APR53_06585 [Methanoculleus sp. SDB]|nr:MAG: hypothetical protein APR53_06585 [Methanoculleus sp. SDB]
MTNTGCHHHAYLPPLDESDMVKIWVISAFIILSGLLTMIAQNPAITVAYPFLSKLTPHLFYIPIVLMSLWYPRRTLQCVVMIMAVFAAVVTYFTMIGVTVDFITSGFTAAIYLWVVAATSTVSRDDPLTYAKCRSFVENRARSGLLIKEYLGMPGEGQQYLRQSREYIDALIEACHSHNREVRESAVQTLDLIGEPAVEPLIRALEDESVATREAVARVLGTIGDTRAIEPLMESLRDESRRVREAGARALAAIGRPSVERLIQGLSDDEWHVRVGSVVALRITGAPETIPDMIRLLSDRSVYVRREAVKTLGRIGDGRAVPPLCRVLREDAREVRIRAAWALGRIGDDSAVDALVDALYHDTEQDVRERSAQALALMRTERARSALMSAARGDENTRAAALEALGSI